MNNNKKCILIVFLIILISLVGCNSKEDNKNNSSKPIVAGHSFMETHDDSLLELNEDLTFKYYRSMDELDDNYYVGTYEFYSKDEAANIVTSERFAKYGITDNELTEYFNRNKDSEMYNIDNLCLLVLKNEKVIMNGEEINMDNLESPYYGFYYNDILDVVKMNSAVIFTFKKIK